MCRVGEDRDRARRIAVDASAASGLGGVGSGRIGEVRNSVNLRLASGDAGSPYGLLPVGSLPTLDIPILESPAT